jgi:protease I
MKELDGLRVLVLASDGVEEAELTKPKDALVQAGAQVDVASPSGEEIQAFVHQDKAQKLTATRSFDGISAADYDALLLPGGALNADSIRMDKRVRGTIRDMDADGKPIAAICHAPWELISAGVVSGRRLTSFHTIQDDIRNAGGAWTDEPVVEDDNWVTSRKPDDIPAFNDKMIALFARARNNDQAETGSVSER